jgi:hypothetical protein
MTCSVYDSVEYNGIDSHLHVQRFTSGEETDGFIIIKMNFHI